MKLASWNGLRPHEMKSKLDDTLGLVVGEYEHYTFKIKITFRFLPFISEIN